MEHLPNTSSDDPAAALMDGALLLGTPLSPHVVAKMVLYLKELMRWSAKVNLTALKTEQDIISKQFLDSLSAFKLVNPSELIRPNQRFRIVDVGSGAGFPGLILKLHEPAVSVTLVEPSAKKAAFLHYIIGLLGLSDAQVIMRKVEDWNDIKPEYDLLTTRALKQEVIFEAAPRVLSPAGRILLYRAKPLELVPATCKIVKELSFTLPFDGSSRTITLLRLITP